MAHRHRRSDPTRYRPARYIARYMADTPPLSAGNCYQDEEVLGVALYRYKIGAVNSGAGANWELLEEYQKEASTYSLYRSTHTIFPGGTDAPLELCLDDSVFFFEAERTRFKICVTIPGKEPNSTLQLTSKELVFENS